jgi:transposase-like protein
MICFKKYVEIEEHIETNGNTSKNGYYEKYTTNTVEGFNRQIGKITKTKGGFSSNDVL